MQPHSTDPFRGALNTLAQSGTETGHPAIILTGTGSDLNNAKALKGRAKRKLITQKMILSLVDVSNNKGDNETRKSYWNTYHCQNKIHTANNKLYGKYCKNRYCTICCCIRKADIINRYLPVLQNWSQPYFVTLTIKAVPFYRLNKVMGKMIEGIKRITGKYRKRCQRGKAGKLIGIRSLECNFNPKAKTYNPHFHLIVPDQETADIFISEWLTLWTRRWASPLAQDKRKVFNNQIALIEIVKYGSKIFTEPDLNKKVKAKDESSIYTAALDNIFKAMKGLRIFERFGFNLPKQTQEKPGLSIVKEFEEWDFDLKQFDWINNEGKKLTDFEPLSQLLEILDNRIDIILE